MEPNLINPKALKLDEMRPKPRRLSELPMWTKSKAEIELPNRASPKTLTALPHRAKFRTSFFCLVCLHAQHESHNLYGCLDRKLWIY